MNVYEIDDPRVAHATDRPRPEPDRVSAPFWAAAARGQLVVQRCVRCGEHQFYPRPLCTRCTGDVEWSTVAGTGTLYTFTVIRQNLAQPFAGFGPYITAMVVLDEGPMMMSNLTDVDPANVRIGMPVECYAVRLSDDIGIPFWRPASP